MTSKSQREARKRHYHANREKCMGRTQEWREKNREKYNAYMRELRAKKKVAIVTELG